jgi:divalent metal cation (Fe/Co/Zn/Cd) transporter
VSRDHLNDALRISVAAVAWAAITGVASIIIGLGANSTALLGTGADVVADMLSSVVLIWRFHAEIHQRPASATAEKRAERVASLSLVIVAIGITVTAIIRLTSHEGASSSTAGIVVAAASALTLPLFAVAKYRIARAIGSPALRMDGNITGVGAAMSVVTLAGLAVTSALHWSSADPIAALVIAAAALWVGATGLRRSH